MPVSSENQSETFLTAAQVAERYNLSKMTLWRWCNDARYRQQGFPCPMKFGARNYWRLSELESWERSRAVAIKQPTTKPPKSKLSASAQAKRAEILAKPRVDHIIETLRDLTREEAKLLHKALNGPANTTS
ncbi:MAG: helix-turn-helix domain-containing protein [Hyphomicrobiales bacterium]|nr:helix-turn-helix domain-containing protein [Hyphomicrobiales bacterium]